MTTASPALAAAASSTSVARRGGGLLLPAISLWWRDIVRFYRQPSRIVGAIASPFVFWLLIGSGIGSSFRPPASKSAINFLEFFYPGIIAMILLFTAIFSTISLIEDREAGFLQGVLVAPVSRGAIVLGKMLGGTTLSLIQGGIFMLFMPWAGLHPTVTSVALMLASMTVLSFALTGVGFMIAWHMRSIQGFHAIMTTFLLPMWMLSGAVFPASGAQSWIAVVMALNPMSYGVDALRAACYGGTNLPEAAAAIVRDPFPVSMAVTVAFAAVAFLLCYAAARRPALPGAKARKPRRSKAAASHG